MLKIKLLNGEEVSVKPKNYISVTLEDGSTAYIKALNNHKSVNQMASSDIEGLYDDIKFYPEKPGCIMMDVEPLTVLEHVDNAEADLVDDTEWDNSAVPAESISHVTLLYGLMENGNTWKDKVDAVLKGWTINSVTIEEVGYFDIKDSIVIVAKLEVTEELVDAHNRLLMLPNAQTFSDYHPHVTLAYIKKTADADKWIKALGDIYNGSTLNTIALNYGDPEKKAKHSHDHDVDLREDLVEANNSLSDETNNLVSQSQASLQNSVQNLEDKMVATMINKITKAHNAFESQDDMMSKREREEYLKELTLIMSAYYTTLFPIYANQLIRKRATEFGVTVPFKMDKDVQAYIEITAKKASDSHINTIIDDIQKATKEAYDQNLNDLIEKYQAEGGRTDKEIFKLAREKAMEGASQQRIISAIRTKYQEVSKTRAKTIARTETNRAFTQSQFQADIQFLNNSGLMEKAYKKWETRSGNPCNYCSSMASKPAIPFETNFANIGDEISATFTKENGTTVVKKLKINYEPLSAGNAHVNCSCRYVLIVK